MPQMRLLCLICIPTCNSALSTSHWALSISNLAHSVCKKCSIPGIEYCGLDGTSSCCFPALMPPERTPYCSNCEIGSSIFITLQKQLQPFCLQAFCHPFARWRTVQPRKCLHVENQTYNSSHCTSGTRRVARKNITSGTRRGVSNTKRRKVSFFSAHKRPSPFFYTCPQKNPLLGNRLYKKASIRWQDSAPQISGYWPTSEPKAG